MSFNLAGWLEEMITRVLRLPRSRRRPQAAQAKTGGHGTGVSVVVKNRGGTVDVRILIVQSLIGREYVARTNPLRKPHDITS